MTLDDQRVLIVNRSPEFLPGLPRQLSVERPRLVAETVRDLMSALDRLRNSGYDAVLLAVDKPDGLSLVLRIRDTTGPIPLLALAPRPLPALDFLAREGLADEVIHTGSDVRLAAKQVGRVLETWRLLALGRRAVRRARELKDEFESLGARRERLLARSFDLHRLRLSAFRPLIVEPDPADAVALRGGFECAGLRLDLPVVHDGGEAIRHLSGGVFPAPSLLVISGARGSDDLAAIRSREAGLPAFALGDPVPGCQAWFRKPETIAGWIHAARRIAVRWSRLKPA